MSKKAEVIRAHATCSAKHLVAATEIAREVTDRYGILSVTSQEVRLFHVVCVVEKLTPAKAPSCLAVIWRYIPDD